MKIFLTSFLITISIGINAQLLSGKVIDTRDQSVSFAHVYIEGTDTGTVTDESGRFQLNTIVKDTSTLVVSSVSYHTLRIKIKDIPNPRKFIVRLKLDQILMDEVDVNMKDHEASGIVEKALLNYHENYDFSKYELKGHYSEAIRFNDQYQYFTEALFTMQDRGYHKEEDKKFRLDAVRHSKDWRVMDSLDVYYDTAFQSNTFTSIFNRDYIDSNSKWHSVYFFPFVGENFLESHEFLIDSIGDYHGHEAYYMSFFLNRKKNKFKLSGNIIEYHNIVITTKEYAVVSMTIGRKPRQITTTKTNSLGNKAYLVKGGFTGYKIINYQKYKSKWYPFEIIDHAKMLGGDRQKSSLMAFKKLRQSKGTSNDLEYDKVTYNGRKLKPNENNWYKYSRITINKINNKKDGFKEIRNKELFITNTPIRNIHTTYNQQLWAPYEDWNYDEELKNAIRMIEHKTPIENQFRLSPFDLGRNFVFVN